MKRGRAPWYEPADLDAQQRALYDAIAGGRRAQGPQAFPLTDASGRLEGPFNMLLASPQLGSLLQELGAAIRFGTRLDARTREIAILEIAAARRCEFEWYAHTRIAAAMAMSAEEIAALRYGTDAPTFDEGERLVREVVRALVHARDLSDDIFARARAMLDDAALMELTVLVGYYEMLAVSLRVWRTPLPAGVEPAFPAS